MCGAATLHASGKTDINSAADVAEALKPIAGKFALLSSVAGLSAQDCCPSRVWPVPLPTHLQKARTGRQGVDHKPWEAVGFYAVIAVATLFGLSLEPLERVLLRAARPTAQKPPTLADVVERINEARPPLNASFDRRARGENIVSISLDMWRRTPELMTFSMDCLSVSTDALLQRGLHHAREPVHDRHRTR